MNFGDICTEVEVLLQDSSSEIVSRIPGAVNEALFYAVDKVDIPALKRLVSVTTIVDQAWASLPSSSAGKLLHVSSSSSNGSEILILSNLEDLLERSPSLDYEGDVEMVALEGSTLYYQSIPSTATALLVLHYIYPDNLAGASDVPMGIPESTHRKLLIHGAAAILYEYVEDGLDEKEKTNTIWHTNLRDQGIVDLLSWRAKNKGGKMRNSYSV